MLENSISFSEDYLRAVVAGQIMGSFAPFTTRSEEQVEAYIRTVVDRLRANSEVVVAADFNSYGSGYASYVPVSISRADESDTVTLATGQRVIHETQGMLLYISRLAPYWYYGASSWTKDYDYGSYTGGSGTFLEPADQSKLSNAQWGSIEQWLVTVLTEYHYELLTQQAVSQPASVSITTIPTILSEPPYQVFDCFFYWED